MSDDDEEEDSNILRLDQLVERPRGMRQFIDAKLLIINDPISRLMAKILARYDLDPQTQTFRKLPTPTQAKQALRNWLDDLGEIIDDSGLHDAARYAVFPVPPGVSHDETLNFFVRVDLPSIPTLLHVLFSLGISPHTITGATLLHRRATAEHETSHILNAVKP